MVSVVTSAFNTCVNEFVNFDVRMREVSKNPTKDAKFQCALAAIRVVGVGLMASSAILFFTKAVPAYFACAALSPIISSVVGFVIGHEVLAVAKTKSEMMALSLTKEAANAAREAFSSFINGDSSERVTFRALVANTWLKSVFLDLFDAAVKSSSSTQAA